MKETAAERKTTTDRIKLKVAYADFWGTFAPEQFGVLKILSRDFDLVMDQDDPDLLICSIFGSDAQKYKCPRVLFIGEAMSPNFRHYDYVIGCDRLSYPGRYLRLPVYLNLFRAETTLELTAKNRGMLLSGGVPNTERAAITVLDEFRGTKLGRISLEKPEKPAE